jgi:pyruvate dehydrogenase E1 component alpha subunit
MYKDEHMKKLDSVDVSVARKLLEVMMRIRNVEEAISSHYAEWKMRCPTHLCTGQEAVAAGVCMSLRKNDFAVSTHRAHGHYIAKGGDINSLIAEIYGKATGCSRGKGGSMHLVDLNAGFMGSTAIVGGTIPIGVGLGLSIKLKKTDQVSVVFFGDGAVEEGVFYESVNFAVLKKLPVLFICENNLYSVYSPLSVRQPGDRNIHTMVEAMGIHADFGDGNNVWEVYTKADYNIKKIREGDGPRFIEFATYRWREHCGHLYDNDLGYRSEEEFLCWKEKDPIGTYVNHLLAQDIITRDTISEMERKILSDIEDAFNFAESSSFPPLHDFTTDLFKE